MATTQAKTPATAPAKASPATKKAVAVKPATKATPTPGKAPKAPLATKVSELPVENRIAPLVKKKNDKKKVIRDSFSFPEQDYHKISELKKICLAAGVHVKKGEILRAGLQMLTNLKLSELLQAVEKVERVRTGRPKADKH
jgi:hypothetical protein